MLQFRNHKTGFLPSLAWPASPTGLLCLAAVTAGVGVGRFTTWVFSSGMGGLSSAGIIVLDVMIAAYLARYVLVAIETTAEGYDLAPRPPDPRETEELFSGILKLVSLLFFCFLPLFIIGVFSLNVGPVVYALIGLGTLYFPMGMLAMAVTGDLTRCFPGSVLPAIFAAPLRYVPSALVCAAAGCIFYLALAGPLADVPLIAGIGLDLGASWLLLASLTRMGVIYREEAALSTLLPFPEPEQFTNSNVIPPPPMTEIEKILAQRDEHE